MRIHTTLTEREIRSLLRLSNDHRWPIVPDLVFEVCDPHRSQIRPHAYEVRLSGHGQWITRESQVVREPFRTATWDEWGVFLGRLYAADPEAVCGSSVKYARYLSAHHFHRLTGDRFRDGLLPPDTHPRHKWEPNFDFTAHCRRCSAYFSWEPISAAEREEEASWAI